MLLPLAQALNLKLPKPLHLLRCVVKGWSKNKQFYIQPIVLWENQSDHQPDHTIFFNSKSKLSDIYQQSGIASSDPPVIARDFRNASLLFYLSRQNFNCCSTGSFPV
ncbi:hypothetical protein [Brasilonema bromeliae]|uniref:Uncharacterized protein n=1 Tax=Brasilonema bromeliae SPC951 TaxID=385972 RepID=A0ABX1P691_9CYAN|nr:hypothetical protein [Brasilonema bromeliae]NMG19902.1 hypothetical protein [Brasilonema bromeliae SPC951]